jgi:hypothetical protein
MTAHPVHRLPTALETAVQGLKLTARQAVERSIESLGLAALAAQNAFARDGLLGAQFELNRKSAVFALRFNDALDERIARELGSRTGGPAAPATASPPAPSAHGGSGRTGPGSLPGLASWESFSLVEDREMEDKLSAERLAMEIGHGCEWELRELDAYVRSVLPQPPAATQTLGGLEVSESDGTPAPNPLRPEVVGHALYAAIGAVSDRADLTKTLAGELGRSMAALLPAAYAAIVGDMRHGGVKPRSLAVRPRGARGGSGGSLPGEPGRPGDDAAAASGGGVAGAGFDSRHGSAGGFGHVGGGGGGGGWAPSGQHPSLRGAPTSGLGATSGHGPYPGGGYGGSGAHLGQVAPGLMHVIRRIAHHDSAGFGIASGPALATGAHGAWHDTMGFGGGPSAPLPNLIQAHRDELRQASSGPLDHLVIDVIASLFDAILADPKVPPQMARQIARLQLPVLRAALGDPAFFSSRKHPVRRFVNRIASLGAAFEDFGDERAKALLAKVRSLVQQVVEGDFEQIAVYEQQLSDLEAFVAEQNRAALHEAEAADELLAAKENEARLAQVYAARLQGELRELAAPDFVRDFLATTWGQVLVKARLTPGTGGEQGPLVQRLRAAGRELFLSVMPKASPAHRKQFLAELPKLMATLTEGLDLIAWPEANRRDFFGRLMPAHAEALKAAAARQLDLNLAARQVEMLLEKPLPSREEVQAAAAVLPVLTEEVPASAFTPAEAERVGLLKESAVDWTAPVPTPPEADIPIEIPAPIPAAGQPPSTAVAAETPETPVVVSGRALADEVQVGYPYQMLIEGTWTRVRLVHVSPGRSFFAFQHGTRHKKTISLTQRMLIKMCEAGRLRAYESAELMDRASSRARQQLAALAAARG